MTRLAAKLKDRVSILMPVQTVNDDGGFNRSYEEIAEIWAEIIPIAQASRDIAYQAAYIRGTQIKSVATHKMIVRRIAVYDIGAQFSSAFSAAFPVSGNLEILKSEFYVFRQRGQTYIGNLFQILSGVDDNSNREFIHLRLREVEEQGIGAPA